MSIGAQRVGRAFVVPKENAAEAALVDGAPLGSATAAPWSQDWTVPTDPGSHTITVTATDAAGNADLTPATADFTVKKKKKKH